MSALQNFLGEVFRINGYYNSFLEALVVNDVHVEFYYIGRMVDALLDFGMVEYTEYLGDLDWDADNYVPYNPNADHSDPSVAARSPTVKAGAPSLAVVLYTAYAAINRLDKDLAINPLTLAQ